MKKKITFTLFLSLAVCIQFQSQNKKIDWLTFSQLEDSLKIKPKKVFVFFYADWCNYCKKMEKVGFTKSEFIKQISAEYYAVKMNAESRDTIRFYGSIYSNNNFGKSRKPIHQIPLLLASRKNHHFTLPATLILDEHFKITNRYFEYLSPKKLVQILKK